MKLTENTKVRIRVPKHLYESIQAELGKMEGSEMEEAKKEMSHGLLQKMIDDLLAKYGETEQTKSDILIALRAKINDALNAMHPQLKSKFREEEIMEEENLQEFDPKAQGAMDVLSAIPGIDKIAQIDPFIAGVTLVGMVAGALIALPKAEAAYKAIMQKLKPAKQVELASAAKEANVDLGGEAAPVDEVHELEEVFDLETLMEAVKDASKKKVEDKKKKEAEAKKKKEVEDKKKKEADAKKKAEAAKKK